jgi:hypothetical protein
VWIFAEGGKPENPEKNPRSKGENQQTTLLTYDPQCENIEYRYEKMKEKVRVGKRRNAIRQ